MRIPSAFIAALLAPLAAGAADVVFRSGPGHVALIELYTSEGCSSCPPAERWLGELRDAAGLWREFVPVAFHVNYWDHLGWRDALASAAFTDRERAYAAAWRAESVYTPCFVRDGLEWRPGGGAPSDHRTDDASTLVATWDAATSTARLDYTADPRRKNAEGFTANVALLGGGLVSAVKKGENAGRELHHEFVALRWETRPLVRGTADGWTATIALPPRADVPATRHALAVWVTTRRDGLPLQAAGGWLEPAAREPDRTGER